MLLNLPNIKIKNYIEAELIVHAIRLKILPLTEFRLTKENEEQNCELNIENEEKLNENKTMNYIKNIEPLIEFTKNEQFDNLKKEKGILLGGEVFCFLKKNIKRWTDLHDWSTSKACKPKNTPNHVKQILQYYEIPKSLTKTCAKKKIQAGILTSETWRHKLKINNRAGTLQKKTITLTINNKEYQVVSYFRDIEVKNSLLDLPYFQILKKKINENEKLLNDEYVQNKLDKGIDFKKEFDLSDKMIVKDKKYINLSNNLNFYDKKNYNFLDDINFRDDIKEKELIASNLLSKLTKE